jgi:hypothetical protein
MSGFDRGLEIVGVADILAGVDIDQDRSHSSLLSLRFPQWWGLRSGLNSRTLWRFKALMTPMRASIVGPSDDSATRIKTSTAVCHSSICCSAFGSFLDISGGVLESDKLATAGQRDRIFEFARPTPIANDATPSGE